MRAGPKRRIPRGKNTRGTHALVFALVFPHHNIYVMPLGLFEGETTWSTCRFFRARYIYIYIVIRCSPPPHPNVDLFVGFNAICGVLCLYSCSGGTIYLEAPPSPDPQVCTNGFTPEALQEPPPVLIFDGCSWTSSVVALAVFQREASERDRCVRACVCVCPRYFEVTHFRLVSKEAKKDTHHFGGFAYFDTYPYGLCARNTGRPSGFCLVCFSTKPLKQVCRSKPFRRAITILRN